MAASDLVVKEKKIHQLVKWKLKGNEGNEKGGKNASSKPGNEKNTHRDQASDAFWRSSLFFDGVSTCV